MNSPELNGAPAERSDRLQASPSFDRRDQNDLARTDLNGREWWESFWADALDRLKRHIERAA
jgi:hypothetical protein